MRKEQVAREPDAPATADETPALRFATLATSTPSADRYGADPLALRGCQNAARGCTLSDFWVPKKGMPIEGAPSRFREEGLL